MFHRREILQVGCSSFFGLGLAGLLGGQASAASAERRAKSVVLVFLTGGGSHIDMFDPKPESSETKGEFGPIATALPGLQFTDKMPELAARAGKLSIVRSMAHGDNRHLSGSHNALTGSIQTFRGDSNQDKSLNRGDWPSYRFRRLLSTSQRRSTTQPGHIAQLVDRRRARLAGPTRRIPRPQLRSFRTQG